VLVNEDTREEKVNGGEDEIQEEDDAGDQIKYGHWYRTVTAQRASEHPVRRACEQAPQQWARAVSRFPRASHVQHLIYF
jgi:hypothetical protein